MSRGVIFGGLLVVFVMVGTYLFLSQSGDENSTSTAGASLVSVNIPELSPISKTGKILFDENCALCHGENASGRQDAGPPLVHKIYETNHHADITFLLAVKNGVRQHHWPFGNMPPVDGVTKSQVEDIITYVRALQRENGIK